MATELSVLDLQSFSRNVTVTRQTKIKIISGVYIYLDFKKERKIIKTLRRVRKSSNIFASRLMPINLKKIVLPTDFAVNL